MMHRFLHNSLKTGYKVIPKRFSTTNREHSKDSNSNDNDIWEEKDEEQEESDTSQQNKFSRYTKRFLIWGLLGLLGANCYYAVKANYEEEAAKDDVLYNHYIFSVSNAIAGNISKAYNYMLYPPIAKFLPDEPPLRPELLRKTLVLNFEGTLYSKDFSIGKGVLIHLRPGFKKFMDKISQLYDVVLYSNEDTAFMGEVVQTIDPYQKYFMWNLGREFFTTMPDGSYKDLRFINRDPKKFIAVDFTMDSYLNHKDNVILINNYHGETEDNSLKELSLFLEHCANSNIKDVRKEIKKYGSENSVKNYYEEMQKKMDSAKKKRNMLFGFTNKGKQERN